MPDRPDHLIIGCFRDYSPRAHRLIAELYSEFANAEIVISQFSQERGKLPATVVDNETLLQGLSRALSVEVRPLYEAIKRRTLVRKFLLALYARRVLGRDYCVVVEDDLVILDHIPEMVALSRSKTPFILETADGWTKEDQEDELDDYLRQQVGLRWEFRNPPTGLSYNSGLIGLDLTVFDCFTSRNLPGLLALPLRWADQGLHSALAFASAKPVHLFAPEERYVFLHYNRLSYPRRSKIYHALGNSDKTCVNWLYKARGEIGGMPRWKWLAFWVAVQIRWLPGEFKGWLWRLVTPPAKREGVCATTRLEPIDLAKTATDQGVPPHEDRN